MENLKSRVEKVEGLLKKARSVFPTQAMLLTTAAKISFVPMSTSLKSLVGHLTVKPG